VKTMAGKNSLALPIGLHAPRSTPPGVWSDCFEGAATLKLLPVLIQDVLQSLVVGILANQLTEPVACSGLDVIHDLGNDKAYSLCLQLRVNQTEGLSRGEVDVVHGGGVEAEPAQGWLRGVRKKRDLIRELLAIRVIQAVSESVDNQSGRSLSGLGHWLRMPAARCARHDHGVLRSIPAAGVILTTPPYSEGVTWYVMKNPVALSEAQVTAFAKLYPINARPIEAPNGREILETQ